jgi:hypothetical protein
MACASSYRERMAEYSKMPVLEGWYSSIDADRALQTVKRAVQLGQVEAIIEPE